jgi:hypothetical protein
MKNDRLVDYSTIERSGRVPLTVGEQQLPATPALERLAVAYRSASASVL